MEEGIKDRSIWERGAGAGLILGLFTSILLLASHFCSMITVPWLASVLSTLLWLIKFTGCIYLMMIMMKRFAATSREASRRDVLNFGFIAAISSALVFSAFYLIYILYIAPDLIQESMNAAYQNVASMLDSNTEAMFEQMMDNLPEISFFSNLLYCSAFGCILSAIFAGRIVDDNPFNDTDETEDADVQ